MVHTNRQARDIPRRLQITQIRQRTAQPSLRPGLAPRADRQGTERLHAQPAENQEKTSRARARAHSPVLPPQAHHPLQALSQPQHIHTRQLHANSSILQPANQNQPLRHTPVRPRQLNDQCLIVRKQSAPSQWTLLVPGQQHS